MEIKPTYVSFEQAKLLKEKGFDVKVKPFYNGLQNNEFVISDIIQTNNNLPKWYPAPEQWQVVEWLRVKHDIWIEICCFKSVNCGFSIWLINKGYYELEQVEYKSPQEATSSAIDYVLTNLI